MHKPLATCRERIGMAPWRARGRWSAPTFCAWGLEAAFPSNRFPRFFQSSCVFPPPRRGWIPRKACRFLSLLQSACRRPCNVFRWIPWVVSFSSKRDDYSRSIRARVRDTKMQNKEGPFAVSTWSGAAEFAGHCEGETPEVQKRGSSCGPTMFLFKGADGALVAPLDFKSSGRL